MTEWVESIQKAKKSCMVQGNLKKVHYELPDGRQMVEEYNTDTNVVTRRAWKVYRGGEEKWDIELGDPESPALRGSDNLIIQESSSQPIVSKRVTKRNFEWRIRNLPYPLETYSVTADPDEKCLVVRTKNKKYFKKLRITELERAKILPKQDLISFSHKYNTLVITYKKPKEVLKMEEAVLEEVKKLQPKGGDDIGCTPS